MVQAARIPAFMQKGQSRFLIPKPESRRKRFLMRLTKVFRRISGWWDRKRFHRSFTREKQTAVKPTNTGSGTMLFPCRRNGCIRTGCIPHWMWTRCGKQRRILSENMILNRSAASIRRRRRPSALFISLKWKRRAQKSGSVCVETASYIIWCASLPEP